MRNATRVAIGCGVAAIAAGAALALPRIRERRHAAREVEAAHGLVEIARAQARFRETDADGDGRLAYARSLEELRAARLRDEIASGTAAGYSFAIVEADGVRFGAQANPIEPGSPIARWFFIDETGVIRFSTTGPATDRAVGTSLTSAIE